ncbi:peptidoglycan -binding protein [Candidatus Hepatincola sp. Pdp]
MSKKNNYDEAATQAWPSFVDILSSTVLVLCFALLVLVIILTISRITSATKNLDKESSPSSIQIQSDVLGDYRSRFQKLAIIANPSLRREMKIQSDQPTVDKNDKKPIYVPLDVPDLVEDDQTIREPGDSTKQVLGDIPKTIDTQSLEVLKELIIVQRDVISQQRKVLEQTDKKVKDTVREYQSLLALVTKENEVEDIRQKINPTPDKAKFIETDKTGERVSGANENPEGSGNYFLSPPNNPKATVSLKDTPEGTLISFNDNAPFVSKESYQKAKDMLASKVEDYKEGVSLEAKVTDFAVSGAEGQRIAVERLLIFRSMLIDLGVPPTAIKLKTVESNTNNNNNAGQASSADTKDDSDVEQNYGWVAVKKND